MGLCYIIGLPWPVIAEISWYKLGEKWGFKSNSQKK